MEVITRREVLEEFVEEATEQLGDSLKKLVLYGSVARGEESEESDIDVFVVVETEEDLERLEDLAFEIGVMKHGFFISVQGQTESDFMRRKDHPFVENILEEGEVYV